MAVIPWGHSRSRTTSGEKRQNPALEWFSRSGAEPSRQALALLMKQHTRSISVGSNSSKDNSRSSTAQSHRSKESRHSQDRVEKVQRTTDLTSRPTSPATSIASAIERPESSRSFFSKGGSLRRAGSKMSLRSESASSSGVTSPSRFTSSRLGFRRKEQPASPTKGENSTLSISQPFSFQHVTHTEQNHFTGLSRIDESELASQFGAIQASQRAELGLRGIQANRLTSEDRPCSPPPAKNTELPMTPPRPAPPPKDSPIRISAPSPDIRTSRSMENFSRPTPKSPTSPIDTSPPRLLPPHLPSLPEIELFDVSPPKPLPRLPSTVHAVSTDDDTARFMISAPLPTPPSAERANIGQHGQPVLLQGTLRHMSTFPSPKYQKVNYNPDPVPLRRTHEQNEMQLQPSVNLLSSYPRYCAPTDVVVRHVDEWDDAIDDAWDHADDQSDEYDGSDTTSTGVPAAPVLPLPGQISTPSSPSSPSPASPDAQVTKRRIASSSEDAETETHVVLASDRMFGLGIDADDGSPVTSHARRPSNLGISIPERPADGSLCHLPRTTYSAISKSSSQESIILSIASSIMGTQRSSNSSVNPADLARLSKFDEPPSATTSTSSPLLYVEPQKAARPESSCLPLSVLQELTIPESDLETASTNESELLREAHSQEAIDEVAPLPLQSSLERSTSTSSINNHNRTPSASLLNARNRKRTSASSRKPARVSYSLFPVSSPQSTPPSVSS